ncbi:hypothetical protein BKA64DRAFT_624215 [Cadophora sp. MPI-SDFR-AT-0126]|nr:hypothetical protein BKA64DRAFT_624215 [Leotiomycetes sp. MPI-SDFR-AT-0126]
MAFSKNIFLSFYICVIYSAWLTACLDVEAGYNPFSAAQAMIDKSSHSWEWGTAAEALLELYDNQLSVFGSNPFPGGKIPSADPSSVFALRYAKQFINVNGQVLVSDSAVGDPASLGVSAILIGQSDGSYIDAASRQADYILNQAPKWSNGAISHRPDVAEIWADNMAMSFPFLAYLAVQKGDASLMDTTVTQCGLQRAVLKAGDQNWRHIIGPQSQDTGLWSTGNGWAAYGMVRVLHTLQKWSGSSSMTSQASQLKGWIKEILDGAMSSGLDGGLLRNYLNDNSWFGEISGTAMLSAVAYRMAVNDPGTFGSSYISWADKNRKALGQDQSGGAEGIFSPAVDPYSWLDRNEYTSGSPEGQAFGIYLYTAYRDCVAAGVCSNPGSSATTISKSGIGPHETLTVLHAPVTFTAGSAPTGVPCDPSQSCDTDGCQGSFNGLSKYPVCKAGPRTGCQCKATSTTCGAHQSCDLNGCAGQFNGLFLGSVPYATCTKNFIGCECSATSNTCGPHQSCDLNDCQGKFSGAVAYATCSKNFIGCECTATANTCGNHQSCDLNGCEGKFNGISVFPQCSNNFIGCECTATTNTCGSPQSCCGLNGCGGAFDLSNGLAYCTQNFEGCQCAANPGTCGEPQSCDLNNCKGGFPGNVPSPACTGFFKGCECKATSTTCGPKQSCDLNGCAGGYDSSGVARCQGNFQGCACTATSNTCGQAQSCDLNGCKGTFDSNSNTARCRGNFPNCVCIPTSNTCGAVDSCSANGCNGAFNGGNPICTGNKYGCPCRPDPIWIPPPPITRTSPPTSDPTPTLPPLQNPWYVVGLWDEGECNFNGGCTYSYGAGAMNMNAGTRDQGPLTGIGFSTKQICGQKMFGATVICNGDITADCADYGVALYNSRTCRTYCSSLGDSPFVWKIDGTFPSFLSTVLVCDRALS